MAPIPEAVVTVAAITITGPVPAAVVTWPVLKELKNFLSWLKRIKVPMDMKTSQDVGFGSRCAVHKVPKTGLIFWQGNFRRGVQIKDHQAQPSSRQLRLKQRQLRDPAENGNFVSDNKLLY